MRKIKIKRKSLDRLRRIKPSIDRPSIDWDKGTKPGKVTVKYQPNYDSRDVTETEKTYSNNLPSIKEY